ncbi:esterase OVCA2-like [Mercenaria mercenaria]|uniref:esterase OVCA2-like n=1 Tax=Mercenaria mercenaria TaxID=6596 RepID=UPI00234EC572|nr:esterase OVCA2-like [Mercenaria mercenaria]
MASGDDKTNLKILCIHGYRQTSQSFRERTGAFRKIPIIKKHTELVFITAPNRVPSLHAAEGEESSTDQDDRGWWFSKGDNTYMAQDYTDCSKGFDESVELVKKTFEEEGPFDGILSFSQGAAFASVLCGLREQNPESFKFDFAILVAGYKSRQSSHQSYYSVPISIPTLHVYGDTDRIIQKEMSEDLLQYFIEPRILQHDGGHFIPASAPQKKVYTEFLQEMLDRKQNKS